MLYKLICPDCQEENTVESSEPQVGWACDFCGSRSESSLPTNESGELIEQVL